MNKIECLNCFEINNIHQLNCKHEYCLRCLLDLGQCIECHTQIHTFAINNITCYKLKILDNVITWTNINNFIYIKFVDGSKYEGDSSIENNQLYLNGFGKIYYKCGDLYIGCFKNNYMDGYGEIYFTNGNIYKGNFKNSQIHGHGEFFKSNGKYVGDFYHGKIQGQGKIYVNGKLYFEGQLKDNKRHGFGILYSNNQMYIGIFKNNTRCGPGKLFSNGKLQKEI